MKYLLEFKRAILSLSLSFDANLKNLFLEKTLPKTLSDKEQIEHLSSKTRLLKQLFPAIQSVTRGIVHFVKGGEMQQNIAWTILPKAICNNEFKNLKIIAVKFILFHRQYLKSCWFSVQSY